MNNKKTSTKANSGKFKNFIRTTKGKLCVATASVLVLTAATLSGYCTWLYHQPKFHNLTMELGQPLPEISEFLTKHANPKAVKFVTEKDKIDLACVGSQPIVFSHNKKEEEIILTIADTTKPVVTFQDASADLTTELKPEDFIASAEDLSDLTYSFAAPLEVSEEYGHTKVTVVVTDAYGNSVSQECKASYFWMVDNLTIELGKELKKSDLLYDVSKGEDLIDQAQLDKINEGSVGTYDVTSTSGGITCVCKVIVQDTTGPELELNSVKIYTDGKARLEDFIDSATDISGEVETRLMSELTFGKLGKQTVIIEAEDIHGNITRKETTLNIVTDTTPPTFSGVKNLTVEKHSSPNFASGVSANDDKDGSVGFTFNADKVDLSKAGTYYVTYTATDKAGNRGSYRRKVTVNHDDEDTAALVNSIASGLGSDPEAIRDYVRNTISYSSNWGGDDPVWYGFKNKSGNCYVHAKCLQSLLRKKGYSTQLIWVTNKTHYWLIINLGGVWRHIDATPSRSHSRYSLMTDAQRHETLSGRDWDRSAWPACQ